MNARNAHRIRLGIHLAKGDLVAVRVGIMLGCAGMLVDPDKITDTHRLTERAYFRTMLAANKASFVRFTRHARDTA